MGNAEAGMATFLKEVIALDPRAPTAALTAPRFFWKEIDDPFAPARVRRVTPFQQSWLEELQPIALQ